MGAVNFTLVQCVMTRAMSWDPRPRGLADPVGADAWRQMSHLGVFGHCVTAGVLLMCTISAAVSWYTPLWVQTCDGR
jgi:hypothetical protein